MSDKKNTAESKPSNTQTENTPAIEPGFISETELLARLPVSRRTLWQWREDGKIPCVRVPGGRRVIYHLPSVEASLLRLQKGGAR